MSSGGVKYLGSKRCAGISERQQARRKTDIHSGPRVLLRDERSIRSRRSKLAPAEGADELETAADISTGRMCNGLCGHRVHYNTVRALI